MVCEMCGANVRTRTMSVEGASLQVCANCERFAVEEPVCTTKGKVITQPVAERLAKRERKRTPRDIYKGAEELVLVSNYGTVIRNRRNSLGMTQDELAKKINEKKSVIIKIENQDMHPSDKLVKTLERALSVSLKEKVDVSGDGTEKTQAYSRSLTLGDFIRHEK